MKNTPPKRFIDNGFFGLKWIVEGGAVVICPKCQSIGNVIYTVDPNSKYRYQGSTTFRCTQCNYHLKQEHSYFDANIHREDLHRYWHASWHGYARRPCGYCGHQWVEVRRTIPALKNNQRDEEIMGECHKCGHKQPMKITWYPLHTQGTEPVFGLSLAIKKSFSVDKTIWAYNYKHLSDLRDYIAADLRESTKTSGSKSYFMRLPAWVKSAKNRDKVLKVIEQLFLVYKN